ncbi:hypothetical protein [Gorillibacterium sp. CAU 1737]|uniref:hypothetical protein n=1 Tax=Gorillibacterium sp. CAU 1737 TaxID=3140362 RepID=UPI0032612DB9
MAFCSDCGLPVQDGETHECQVLPVKVQPAATGGGQATGIALDKHTLLNLLLNPRAGLSLDSTKEALYGWIGIGGSIIGFFLWGLVLKLKLIWAFKDSFGGLFGNPAKEVPVASNLLVLGILSLATFLVLLWILGNWKGTKKLSFLDAIVKLGGMQLLSGAGFAVAALVGLVWLPGSYLIVSICLLSTLLFTITASLKLFGVDDRDYLPVLGGFSVAYVLVMLIASKLLLNGLTGLLL